jgi:hypothetical protein
MSSLLARMVYLKSVNLKSTLSLPWVGLGWGGGGGSLSHTRVDPLVTLCLGALLGERMRERGRALLIARMFYLKSNG